MTTVNSDPARELIGYTDRLTVAAGGEIAVHVSTDAATYDLEIVELLHGDAHPAGPGPRERAIGASVNGPYAGRIQVGHAGSFGIVEGTGPLFAEITELTLAVYVWATTPGDGREQALISLLHPGGTDGLSLRLSREAVPSLHVGSDLALRADTAVSPRNWYLITAGVDARQARAQIAVVPIERHRRPSASFVATCDADVRVGGYTTILFAALDCRPDANAARGCFNGKLEAPAIISRLLSPGECGQLAQNPGSLPACIPCLARWDFSGDQCTSRLREDGGKHGRLVNMPARASTGVRWTSSDHDPASARESYGAIHFHADDQADIGWQADARWQVPSDLRSGVYAARLDAGDRTECLPFVVTPPIGERRSDIAVLIPTFTHLAYANERTVNRYADLTEAQRTAGEAADLILRRHPEFGVSLYDLHEDGSGCCYASRLRPLLNVRPDYRFWDTGCPERLAADLYLVDWLDRMSLAADFITDEDVHRQGAALLAAYRVVLTGTHPEYCTEAMLDALDGFVDGGGRLMYLGGNGFYWVTSVAPHADHIIEVRRGYSGTRPWESEPGELHHSTTGELGGLWRHRGRPPNRLVGVGFTAQSDSHDLAAAYRRLPASFDPEVAFIFDGVEQDIIGEFGLANGGAAGYEIDRFDADADVPGRVWRLATSAGRHAPSYLLAVEEQLSTQANANGTTSDLVRADMVYVKADSGAEIFSVGSCNWCASLSHNGYANSVSRITENVLRRFSQL